MKKYFIKIMLIILSIFMPYIVKAADIKDNASIIVHYDYEDYNLDNISVSIYKLASIIDSNYDLELIKNKIDTYIDINDIKPTMIKNIKDNKVIITNIDDGLYYIKIDKIKKDNHTLIFNSSLVNIPSLNEDGSLNYQLEIIPKAEIKYLEVLNPITRDNINIYLYLIIGSLLILILLITLYKKYKD